MKIVLLALLVGILFGIINGVMNLRSTDIEWWLIYGLIILSVAAGFLMGKEKKRGE